MQPKMSLNVKLKSVKTNNKKPSNKALVIQFLRIIKVGPVVNLFLCFFLKKSPSHFL